MVSPANGLDQSIRDLVNAFEFVLCDERFSTETLHTGPDTASTLVQKKTERSIAEVRRNYAARHGDKPPILRRDQAADFLIGSLGVVPNQLIALESSRTWVVFWCLNGLRLLNYPIKKDLIDRAIRYLATCQQPSGGFSGSPTNMAHLATTYAAVMAIVDIGTPEAYAVINRASLLTFLRTARQPNGSFAVHRNGEADVRGAYCAAAVADVLGFTRDPVECKALFGDTVPWLLSCQTFDGGFAAEPFVEAHGGYTFCAVAALAILGKLRVANVPRLLQWVAARQMAFEGGFNGRPNKLVDACYSYWVPAVFAIVDDAGIGLEGGLFDTDALQAYLLYICQDLKHGGLFDKPGKSADAYHTSYALSGLSIAQHYALEQRAQILGGEANQLERINPVYNVQVDLADRARAHFRTHLTDS